MTLGNILIIREYINNDFVYTVKEDIDYILLQIPLTDFLNNFNDNAEYILLKKPNNNYFKKCIDFKKLIKNNILNN